MLAYKTEIIMEKSGMLNLQELPFEAGDNVEVIILKKKGNNKKKKEYPLWGTPVEYIEPEEPAAIDEWEVLK